MSPCTSELSGPSPMELLPQPAQLHAPISLFLGGAAPSDKSPAVPLGLVDLPPLGLVVVGKLELSSTSSDRSISRWEFLRYSPMKRPSAVATDAPLLWRCRPTRTAFRRPKLVGLGENKPPPGLAKTPAASPSFPEFHGGTWPASYPRFYRTSYVPTCHILQHSIPQIVSRTWQFGGCQEDGDQGRARPSHRDKYSVPCRSSPHAISLATLFSRIGSAQSLPRSRQLQLRVHVRTRAMGYVRGPSSPRVATEMDELDE